MLQSFATSIVRTLRERGYQAYLVGGCVRDLLLGREPADYDVATDATPQEVIEIFPQTFAVGAQFGVVLVPLPKAESGESAVGPGEKVPVVEVATFRSDVGYSDGRHPDEVRFSNDPQEDVGRRDFTINGLLLDPLTNEVLDYVGGREDLKAGIVRTIGEPQHRFAEDKLRMLRAVRFAARFGYRIDPATLAAIRRLAVQIHRVSRERVREELTKMLNEGHVFVHTMLLLEKLPADCSRTLAWGALLHDVGKPPTFRVAPDRIRFDGHVEVGVKMAAEICRRMHFSNGDTSQILGLVQNHMRFGVVQQMKESTLKKFLRLPGFDEHLELHRIDCLSSHGLLEAYDYAWQQSRALSPEAIRPQPLITGQDLIEAGYEPGPRFKEILGAVEDAQLEGRLVSHEEAMDLVKH